MKARSLFLMLGLCLLGVSCTTEDPLGIEDKGSPCGSSYPDGGQALVRGHVMPNMTFESLEGERFNLEEFRACGEDTLLVLEPFPMWCSGCLETLPVLVELHQRFGDRGLRVVLAIAEDQAHQPVTAPVVEEFLAIFAPELEAWIDPEGKLQAYTSFSTLPMTLVIDVQTMNIILKVVGGESLDSVIEIIGALLEEEN